MFNISQFHIFAANFYVLEKQLHQIKIGVLGGGQLGQMMLQPGIGYGLKFKFLDPDPQAPCSSYSQNFVVGSLLDYDVVYSFGKDCDIITIEIEHVNVKALYDLQKLGKRIFPQPSVIEVIQNKCLQKEHYSRHGIPTSPFINVDERTLDNEIKPFLPGFFKTATGGYDGGGVSRIKDISQREDVLKSTGLVEKAVEIEKELSVIVARNEKGEIRVYPTVELVYREEKNLVDYLISPALISDKKRIEAKELALKVAESFGVVGLLAVELFLDKNGNILVNEVAPRPHNSGHQTIEANFTSQYEQHLRAITGLPLGNTAVRSPSAMINLLGEIGYSGDALVEGLKSVMEVDGVCYHYYGKEKTNPMRKMGHITILDQDEGNLKEKVKFVKETLKIKA